jgi:hypothetical protein
VLNSLIFPGHEQHHNNSFLCAALVMGQSNIAAGATIGSNHNSRAADGEMVTARGFWPGLCVSLKHNSKMATFTLLAKGDYSYELNIPLPFSLVSNDVSHNRLTVMPAYWFLYNLYALARNSSKYVDRDKRTRKLQHIEYDFLAPDSVNEIFTALDLLRKFTALAKDKSLALDTPETVLLQAGEVLLNDPSIDFSSMEIRAYGFENNSRPVVLLKVREAYHVYKRLIIYYGISQLIEFIQQYQVYSLEALLQALPESPVRLKWVNIGGQLMPLNSLQTLFSDIKNNKIKDWQGVHEFYKKNGALYAEQKRQHAYASLLEVLGINAEQMDSVTFKSLMFQVIDTKEWMVKNIFESRAKDYQNEFRKMVYDSQEEMEQVVGKLEDNVFIAQQREELIQLRSTVESIIKSFHLQ